jgi:hypothetical protein
MTRENSATSVTVPADSRGDDVHQLPGVENGRRS